MNKKSQLQFIRHCSILLEAGISLGETLELITALEKSKKNRAVLTVIKENVAKGISLSRSIQLTGTKFNPALLSLISSGESSGILTASLRQALLISEKNGQIQKKFIGALVYPSFIALATFGMTIFLVMYIFPKIIPLFSSLDITLPLLTRGVKWLYESILNYGLWLGIAGLVISVIAMILYKKKRSFRLRIQGLLLTTPGLGLLIQKYYLSASCRTFAVLMECGQRLPEILRQMIESSPWETYRRAWTVIHAETVRGVSLSSSLRSFPSSFPSLVADMLSLGERSGSLASMFNHISRMYEEELDEFIKQLNTMIEPVLMIGMGLVVGSIALSIILPIYEITNHLTR